MQLRVSSYSVAVVISGTIGMLAGLSVLWATACYGAGVSPDSVMYISGAESLKSGRGCIDYTGRPIDSFPPAYPAVLAVASLLFRAEAHEAARWVSAVSFSLIVLLIGLGAWFLTRSVGFVTIASVLTAVARPMGSTTQMARSEPPFIVLVLVCLLALTRLLQVSGTDRMHERWLWLGVAAASAAIACLTRYAGTALVVSALAAIGFGARQYRARTALVFCVFSMLPLLIWMGRNKAVTGHATGPRYASSVTLRENVRLAVHTVGT